MPVNDRPRYFGQSVASLLHNDISGCRIYLNIEPSIAINSQLELAAKLNKIHKNCSIKANRTKLGVRENSFEVIDRAFSDGATEIIYIEDDIVVSPDMTFLASWYFLQPHLNIMCLNLMHGACGGEAHISVNTPNDIVRTKQFNSLGFAITLDQWKSYFQPFWFDDNHGYVLTDGVAALGWDWAIFKHNLREDSPLETLQPRLARANHIGRDNGTFCSATFHDSVFSNLKISDLRTNSKFRIVQ